MTGLAKLKARLKPKKKRLKRTRKTTERGYGYSHQVFRSNLLDARIIRAARDDVHPCVACAAEGMSFEPMRDLQLHHRVKIVDNPDLQYDPTNCEFLCARHHALRHSGSTQSNPVIEGRYVICGPPGSGKTTWVKARAKPGVVVWDMDDVADRLGMAKRYPRQEQDHARLKKLRESVLALLSSNRQQCLVIISDEMHASRVAKQLGAKLITLRSRQL